MESSNEKIIERIQKLLSLSESSNENEAQTALLKAQELLARHKLSMKEIKDFKVNTSKVKEKFTEVSYKKSSWKMFLAYTIAKNFGCHVYSKRYYTNYICFLGREEDADICEIVLEYALDCIYSNIKLIKKEYIKKNVSTKGLESDYAWGFVVGLDEKFKKQQEENQEWQLVLVKDKEVEEAYNNLQFAKTKTNKLEFNGHTNAFNKGKTDGENFDISDKIEAKNEEDKILLK